MQMKAGQIKQSSKLQHVSKQKKASPNPPKTVVMSTKGDKLLNDLQTHLNNLKKVPDVVE
jgi:hypothetical protein